MWFIYGQEKPIIWTNFKWFLGQIREPRKKPRYGVGAQLRSILLHILQHLLPRGTWLTSRGVQVELKPAPNMVISWDFTGILSGFQMDFIGICMYIYIYIYIYIYGPESKLCMAKLCMERSAVFRTYGTKGLRNWSCSGPLECDEI